MDTDALGEDGEALPCLIDCDACEKTREPGLFEGDDPLLTVLADSSVIDDDPQQDGRRMVTLCSPECFTFSWDFYAAWVSSARPNSRA
jgi:hypothetical protein